MKNKEFARSVLPAAGMTLAMFAILAVQMGTTLAQDRKSVV